MENGMMVSQKVKNRTTIMIQQFNFQVFIQRKWKHLLEKIYAPQYS